MSAPPLLMIDKLVVIYRRRRGARHNGGEFRAVDGASLTIQPGETHALVGESGSGKTTLARAILGLVRPSAGTIKFDGVDVSQPTSRARKRLHRQVQMIFQDNGGSLNPRCTIGASVGEPLEIQDGARGAKLRAAVEELLATVGLKPTDAKRYPHEFSGGQRQRICIARALALRPRLLVCDEPVSALDVSIQAQILNLLADLQVRYSIAYLFVTHDLAIVPHISHRVSVMQRGRIVETGPTHDVLNNPQHVYTRSLLHSVPTFPSAAARCP